VNRPPEELLPAGVTGIPRLREWDAVVLVELPELDGSPAGELELSAEPGEPLAVMGAEAVPAGVGDRLAAALDAELERPYDGIAVRQQGSRWAAGARAGRAGQEIELPGDLPGAALEVVRTPDGDRVVQADGEPLDAESETRFAAAVAVIEERGAARFESFVARADKGPDGLWRVSVDPL
jgi:hypothetical protein